MGKTHLVNALRDVADLSLWDDASPKSLVAEVQTMRVVAMGVEHFTALQRRRSQDLWVPLTNLPARQVLRAGAAPETYDKTWGHPALIQALAKGCYAQTLSELIKRWNVLLAQQPHARAVFDTLRSQPANCSPAQRYETLRSGSDTALKPTLDWLCCAGLVTRAIDGDRAGVEALPI